MMRRRLNWVGVTSAVLAVSSATAQSALSVPVGAAQKSEIGGKSSQDLIRLDGLGPSVPLRNSGVLPGSEIFELDGRRLVRNRDYSIDYAGGTVFLLVPTRAGQSFRASYRYDETRKKTTLTGQNILGPSGFALNFAGENQVMFGFGVADRAPDGTVSTSNMYGLRNQFTLAPGASVSGLVLSGEKRAVTSRSLLDSKSEGPTLDAGKSQAILQKLGAKFLGGTVAATWQDISQKFSSFDSFRNAGFDGGFVDQLAKERGLKRASFELQNVGSKDFNVSNAYRNIKDGDSGLEWRSLGLNAGPVKFNWSGQRVDKDFKRFGDLAEADRGQLAKETGMSRETLDLGLALKNGAGSFRSLKVEDEAGGLYRRSADLGVGRAKLQWSDQRVEKAFTRFGSLREADAGQLAREAGMRRQNIVFSYDPGLGGKDNWMVSSAWLRPDEGEDRGFKADELRLGGKKWAFEHIRLGSEDGSAVLPSMSDSEIQGYIQRIGRMIEPGGGVAYRGEDKGTFTQTAGIHRSADRLSFDLGRGAAFMADRFSVGNKDKDGSASRFSLQTSRFGLNYRTQSFDQGLTESVPLFGFEQNRLGNVGGLKRTDLDGSAALPRGGKLTFGQTHANREGEGSFDRTALGIDSKNLSVQYSTRKLDKGFTSAGQLVDPERDRMAEIQGFSQRDLAVRGSPLRGLTISLRQVDARDDIDDLAKTLHTFALNYEPDKRTKVEFYQMRQNNYDPLQILAASSVDRLNIARDLGRFGKLSYQSEKLGYDGTQSNLVGSDRKTFAYEAKIGDRTTVATEQTRTVFEDGGHESISANTLSTDLSKIAGVAVTDVRIDRDGDKPDEQKRNYGFWYDLGKNVRLNYGYARQINSQAAGTMQTNFTVTPGQIGGIAIGAMSYADQRWDTTRFQATGNVQLSTVKPFRMGFLDDVKLVYGADTIRDRGQFQKENRVMSFAGKIGSNLLGWDYMSQVAPNGDLGIDRTFKFATDQNEKRNLRAAISYKLRTLPGDNQVMVRSYSVTARPFKGVELTHQLVTNPEVPRGDLLLGSQTQAERINRWKLDFTGSARTKFGVSWDELINDQAKSLSRVANLNLTLNADNPSPFYITYGLEQTENAQTPRRTQHRYSIRYDQRPGPNQMFSLFLGNISWQHSRPDSQRVQNWSMRLEWQVRF